MRHSRNGWKVLAAGAVMLASLGLVRAPAHAGPAAAPQRAEESMGFGTMDYLTCEGTTWTQWRSDTRAVGISTAYQIHTRMAGRWVHTSGARETAAATHSATVRLGWAGVRGRENRAVGAHTFSHLSGVFGSGTGTLRCN